LQYCWYTCKPLTYLSVFTVAAGPGRGSFRKTTQSLRAEDRVQNKWLSSWRGQDNSSEHINGAPKPTGGVQTEASVDSPVPSAYSSGNGFAASRMDLLALDEIYRSAGIKGPRLGYTIEKVIEMVQSEHIKTLPTETKRSALLMALDAAGVQVDEVLHDAILRQHAITSHEATQCKRLEEYEARKAQENVTIQGEAERAAAEYAARISHNLDEVAREKESFRKWQAKEKYEAQRIAAAVALFLTQSGAPTSNGKPPADRMAAFRELAAAYNDPAFVDRS
jgi:hypothetical protein